MEETVLERIRKTLNNVGLPPWASWVDRALEQEDRRMRAFERRSEIRLLSAEPSKDGGT